MTMIASEAGLQATTTAIYGEEGGDLGGLDVDGGQGLLMPRMTRRAGRRWRGVRTLEAVRLVECEPVVDAQSFGNAEQGVAAHVLTSVPGEPGLPIALEASRADC